MNFNVLFACFAFLVAASVCEGASDKKDSTSPSLAKYKVTMNKDGKNYEEQIDINKDKGTETFHVPKTSPNEEAGDIVFDFKQNLTMVRLPVAKSCFLSEGTGNVPQPAELVQLLESKSGVAIRKPQAEVKFKVIGTLEDRSRLSDEMADLCAALPIYIVEEGELDSNQSSGMAKPTSKARTKRGFWRKDCRLSCTSVCYRVCVRFLGCRTICRPSCSVKCTWRYIGG